MKKVLLYLLLILYTQLIAETNNEQSQIEIKGLSIGMTIEDVSKLYDIKRSSNRIIAIMHKEDLDKKDISYYYLTGTKPTIAGKKIFDLGFRFYKGKLDGINYMLYSDTFEAILNALKGKYQEIHCSSSNFQNGYGATFEQINCSLNGVNSKLYFKRYFEKNIKRSILDIESKRKVNEINNLINKEKNDI